MKLGEVLRKWRLMNEADIRQTAKTIGLDPVTYLRVEQGKMPSAPTLLAVWKFLTEGK